MLIGANLLAQATNDDLCNAITIEINENCSEAKQIDLANGTIETGEELISPTCTDGDTMLTSTVWFSFVAPEEEIYILAEADDKSNSQLAYQMQLFSLSGECTDINNLELVNCNTPAANILESPVIQTTLTAGETYYIQISGRGFSGFLDPFVSTGCLTISTVNAPTNDNVCNAISLEVDAEPQFFSNVGASAEEGEAAIAPPPSSNPFGFVPDGWALGTNLLDHSVWFTFTTREEGGNYTIDLGSSFGVAGNFNAQVAVYEAVDCGDFTSFEFVGAADNGISQERGSVDPFPILELFCLQGNKTYYIVVDGGTEFFFRPIAAQGTFSIQVREQQLEPLDARFLIEGPTCEGGENGSILALGLGGAGNYDYRWNTGDSTTNLSERLAAGTYTLTITDQCGVRIIETVEVPAPSRADLGLASSVSGAACEGAELSLDAMAFDGFPIEEQRVFFQTSVSQQLRALTQMELENTASRQVIAENQTILFLQFEFVEDQLYATDSGGNLYSIDTENGRTRLVAILGIGPIAGLSYVPTTSKLYCINTEGAIYEYDLMTKDVNLVLELSFSTARAAIDHDENIILLGTDGSWYTSSFETATLRNIGFFNTNTLPMTALEVDPSTGKVYYTVSRILAQGAPDQWQSISELNTATGRDVRILSSFTSRFSAFAIKANNAAPYTYEWTPTESFDDPSLANQTTILEETTTYMVSASDACETVMEEIVVEAMPNVETTLDTSIVKGETYNGIVIETDTTILEIVETENGCESRTINIMVIISNTQQTWAVNAIQISPNPTRNILNVSLDGVVSHEPVNLRIVDVHGRILFAQQLVNNGSLELHLDGFTSGLYFLEIKSTEKFAVRQFVKL